MTDGQTTLPMLIDCNVITYTPF